MINNSDNKSLSVIHLAMCSGTILMTVLLTILKGGGVHMDKLSFQSTPTLMIGTLVSFATIVTAMFIIRRKPSTEFVQRDESLEEIKRKYILTWALLEAGVIVNVMLYFSSDSFNPLHILYAIIGICLMLLLRPRF
jgi:hypothetical protein